MNKIQMVLEAYLETRVKGDVEQWLSLWDKNGVQLFPGSSACNMAELKNVTRERFEAVTVNSAEIDTRNITVADGYAIAHGNFLIEREADGKAINFDGKFLTILKRQPDGSWKIFRDCSNSNNH